MKRPVQQIIPLTLPRRTFITTATFAALTHGQIASIEPSKNLLRTPKCITRCGDPVNFTVLANSKTGILRVNLEKFRFPHLFFQVSMMNLRRLLMKFYIKELEIQNGFSLRKVRTRRI